MNKIKSLFFGIGIIVLASLTSCSKDSKLEKKLVRNDLPKQRAVQVYAPEDEVPVRREISGNLSNTELLNSYILRTDFITGSP